jgi:starch phosphorylase
MNKNNTAQSAPMAPEHIRTGLSAEALRQAFLDNLFYVQGRSLERASANDLYQALAYTLRDRILQRWMRTVQTYRETNCRTVCYLSAEYLPGPHLGNNLLSLGIIDNTRAAMRSLNLDLDAILGLEEEPGLGNGGLGRLAACFMDSLAALEIPAIGYGIRYEYGIFDQDIVDGWQVETSDTWLHYGNPWEVRRPNICFDVKIGGRTETYHDEHGHFRVRWLPGDAFRGVAHDTPVPGYGALRNGQQGALSERRRRGRQAPAPDPAVFLREGRPGIVRNPQKKRLADCSKTKSHLADAKAGFHRPVLFN